MRIYRKIYLYRRDKRAMETFVLKHGESHTFPDLPVGAEYTVTETDCTAEGYTATVKTYTGAITGEEELFLPFVNVYQPEAEPGGLTVEKKVGGRQCRPGQGVYL